MNKVTTFEQMKSMAGIVKGQLGQILIIVSDALEEIVENLNTCLKEEDILEITTEELETIWSEVFGE